MNFILLMSTFGLGIASMLAIMGTRQWKMGFRIAGGLSLVVSVLIVGAGIWLLSEYV